MVAPFLAAGAGIMKGIELAGNIASAISVAVLVQDMLSPKLAEYSDQLDGLDAQVNEFTGAFNVPISTGALDAVRASVSYIHGAIMEAAQMQTSMIASASDLATNMKIPIDQAIKMGEDSQTAIAGIAAALPGETAGYADIFRSISGTLSKQFSGDEFKKESEEFTKRIGILTAIRGSDPTMAGIASNRLLGGTMTPGEAIQQDLFARNVPLLENLYDEMEKMQVSPNDWRELQQSVRTQIFSAALAKAAPDALIKAFEGTFQGTMESLKTQLFDPISGLFGVLRRVESQDGMHLLDAVNGIFQTLNNLKERVVGVLQSTGINLDPFHYLIGFFRNINEGIGELLQAGLSENPMEGIKKFVRELPERIAEMAVNAVEFLAKIARSLLDVGLDGGDVGKAVGSLMGLFERLKMLVLENVNVRELVQIYYEIQKEMADLQGAMWIESIKLIPIRMGNWINDVLIKFQLAFVPISITWNRFIEFIGSTINKLMDMLKIVANPFNMEAAANEVINKPKNVANISGSPLSVNAQTGIRAITSGLNPVQLITDKIFEATGLTKKIQDFAGQAKPLETPKPIEKNILTKDVKTSFAPIININGGSGNPKELADMVLEQIYTAYSEFTENSLA